jgi:hypothetical protein
VSSFALAGSKFEVSLGTSIGMSRDDSLAADFFARIHKLPSENLETLVYVGDLDSPSVLTTLITHTANK